MTDPRLKNASEAVRRLNPALFAGAPVSRAPLERREAAFQESVIDLLTLRRFRIAHFRPVQTPTGWRTPVAADGAGFPDLLAVRKGSLVTPTVDRAGRLSPGLILALELKVPPNTASREQEVWLEHFAEVPGCLARVLTPDDWDWLLEVTE